LLPNLSELRSKIIKTRPKTMTTLVMAMMKKDCLCSQQHQPEFVIITFKIRKNKAENDDNLQLVMAILFLF
jgi:hypothetical protein